MSDRHQPVVDTTNFPRGGHLGFKKTPNYKIFGQTENLTATKETLREKSKSNITME